jgi:hypothetical protein
MDSDQVQLDGEFKEYKRIKIVGEKVYGDVKPSRATMGENLEIKFLSR